MKRWRIRAAPALRLLAAISTELLPLMFPAQRSFGLVAVGLFVATLLHGADAPSAPPLNPGLPCLFVAGDSTAAVGKGDFQQGWAVPFAAYFESKAVKVVNCARGGRSSRTFMTEGSWPALVEALKPHDVVLIQFGHNDEGAINEEPPGSTRPLRARGTLPGLGEETKEIDNVLTKQHEIVHTFGWYLRRMIAEVRGKGATPVLLSPTVRNRWMEGRLVRDVGHYSTWTRAVADAAGVAFVDVNARAAERMETLGVDGVKAMFSHDDVHYDLKGADLHAQCVVAGLKALRPSLILPWLSVAGQSVR